MALYKRGNVYWGSFTHNGRRIQRSTGTTNCRAAGQILAAWRVAAAKGDAGLAERVPAPTLRNFARRFLDFVGTRSAAKPNTVSFYANYTAALLGFEALANAPLDRIDEALVEQWVTWRSRKPGRPIKPATVNRGLATLRRMLRLAQEWRLVDRVPRIRMVPGEKPREAILSPEQEQAYLTAAPQPLRDIAVLVLDTGLRLGECLALRWADVSEGWLTVRDGKSRYARRSLPLTARVRAMLNGRKASVAADPAALVFGRLRGDGRALRRHTVDQQHQRVRAALSLPAELVIHSLRHTALTRLGAAGADAFTIQRIGGHSSVLISQRYVHPVAETVSRAFERLEAANGQHGHPGATAALPPSADPNATVPATLPAKTVRRTDQNGRPSAFGAVV